MKRKVIDIEYHAFIRSLERGQKFGLDYEETKEMIYETVRRKNLAKRKHISRKYRTYYNYFKDNLSFYVICREREFKDHVKILIKTIIIEIGRE